MAALVHHPCSSDSSTYEVQTYNVSSFLRFLSCVVADSNRCVTKFSFVLIRTLQNLVHGTTATLFSPPAFVFLCSLDSNSLAWIRLNFVAKCIGFFVYYTDGAGFVGDSLKSNIFASLVCILMKLRNLGLKVSS